MQSSRKPVAISVPHLRRRQVSLTHRQLVGRLVRQLALESCFPRRRTRRGGGVRLLERLVQQALLWGGERPSSVVISGHQCAHQRRSSVVISTGHQWSSVRSSEKAIREGHHLGLLRSSEVIRGHQRSSVVISGHQWSSVVISGHQRRPSPVLAAVPQRGQSFC
jgi:hypothetical protein